MIADDLAAQMLLAGSIGSLLGMLPAMIRRWLKRRRDERREWQAVEFRKRLRSWERDGRTGPVPRWEDCAP